MRLLHIYGGQLYGGVERLLVTLWEQAAEAPAIEQRFALCHAGRLARELEARGAEIHWLGEVRASRPWQVLRARRRLRHWLAASGVEAAICHSWWPYAVFAPAVRAAGLPVGLWVHETATGKGWLERWAARPPRPELLLTWGTGMAAALERLFPGQAVAVIHPPVAPPARLDTAQRLERRRQWGAGDADVVLLQASRLEPWKGHGLLLDALARLRALPGWQLWIAGGVQRPHEAEYLHALQAQAQRLGLAERVHWLGERQDMKELLQAADIFCQPNTAPEPFGLVFVEALAAGTPVVATAHGGALEIVTPACGLLTPPAAPALAAALETLITDAGQRQAMAEAAPERARALSAPARQMRQFQSCLLELAR